MPTRVTSLDEVESDPPYLFTVADQRGDEEEEEVILIPCEDGVEAWVNSCTHEAQRLERGHGASLRDGEIVCPKHGSLFDACAGDCENGPAAGTTLVDVGVTVNRGDVFLVDDGYEFRHEGPIDDDGDPASSSHLRL
jgi:nitrite reductase/ring-hydroxylating ferredoxin subunit